MKKKGFTLVELLVVIAIIALLMGILMPALSRVRQIAFRMVCGTNLAGIGKAMLIYANDYDDELPCAGGQNAVWSNKINDPSEKAKTPQQAYAGKATITSSFYLLVKYSDVTPKSFLCKGDSNVNEFMAPSGIDLVDLWDFASYQNCSYTYHLPYLQSSTSDASKVFRLTTSSEPGLAAAADPTPWTEQLKIDNWKNFVIDGSKDQKNFGNASTHQNEGQNVMYLDTHVNFESVAFCGVNEDNIYTIKTSIADIKKGTMPTKSLRYFNPFDRTDSLLVSDQYIK